EPTIVPVAGTFRYADSKLQEVPQILLPATVVMDSDRCPRQRSNPSVADVAIGIHCRLIFVPHNHEIVMVPCPFRYSRPRLDDAGASIMQQSVKWLRRRVLREWRHVNGESRFSAAFLILNDPLDFVLLLYGKDNHPVVVHSSM